MNQIDVLVVSAFGRGQWLAAELRAQKMQVLLLDVTSKLGVWPPEDGEGPFGVFKVENFEDSFLEYLNHGDPIENVENGFCVWLPSGPLELKGPLTRYHWERLKMPARWLDSLARGERVVARASDSEFLRMWPLALASQLASTHFVPAVEAVASGRQIPLAATFGVRFPTRKGVEQSLRWLRDRGVVASDKTDVLDLSFASRKQVSGVELKGEISGLRKIDQLVWTLTGSETRFMSEKIALHLFPKGVVNPSWAWVRYRLTMKNDPTLQRLPLHTVLFEDVESPWSHSNLMILQKTASERSVDAWMRIPAVQRFNRGYVEEHGRRLIEILSRRLPKTQPEIQSLPQEASYTSQEIGEARYPVWTSGLDPARTRLKAVNVHFESAENRETYSLDEEYEQQKNLRDQLIRQWQLKQERLQKEKQA